MRAVFAGSFDPPTLGHLDIIRRASPVFSQLRVVVAHNLQKQPLFSFEERIDMLRRLVDEEKLTNVVIDYCDGLIAEYARKNDCGILLRSIRNMIEIPTEQVMATMNYRLEKLETVFMFSRQELSDISSTAVRELVIWKRLPRDIVSDLVKKEIEKRYGPLFQD